MNIGSGVWVTAGRAPEGGGMNGMAWSASSDSQFFGRLGGYGDVKDADLLGLDPAI